MAMLIIEKYIIHRYQGIQFVCRFKPIDVTWGNVLPELCPLDSVRRQGENAAGLLDEDFIGT